MPFNNKIYFVAYDGLYVKSQGKEEITKITKLPLKSIQSSKQLDERTLILGSKITYYMDSDTWVDKIQLFDYTQYW